MVNIYIKSGCEQLVLSDYYKSCMSRQKNRLFVYLSSAHYPWQSGQNKTDLNCFQIGHFHYVN